jgi:molybdopterin molybdotransferase
MPPSEASSAASPAPAGMLGVHDTRERLVNAVAPLSGCERLPLVDALGRVVVEAVVAAGDLPPFANSAMDGFALRFAELEAGQGVLSIEGRIAAGEGASTLAPGVATRIFTGAVVPHGADTVVPVERCRVEGATLRVDLPGVRHGDHIRRAGEDVARGEIVLPIGRRLRPQDLGMAAAVGTSTVGVGPRPRVALLVTGDELVPPGRPTRAGQIHDSNGPMLVGLLHALGCAPSIVSRVGDTRAATLEALRRAAPISDLIVSSGGVSVGEEDHLKDAVRSLGTLDLWRVAAKPGQPLGFGHVDGVPWLGLPGNPVSVFVTFLLFGAPLVRRLQGREPLFPTPVLVGAGFERPRPISREEYLRVRIADGRIVPYAHQGSGVLSSTTRSDGLAVVPAGSTVRTDDPLPYLAYTELLG